MTLISRITAYFSLLTFALLITACSNSGPGDTAEKFMTHLSKAEFTEAKQYASQPTGELIEMMGKMGAALGKEIKDDKDFKFILVDEIIKDDKATVNFRKKEDGDIETMHLIKEDDTWKVHEEKK